MIKKKLLISFSGGLTSGFMTKKLFEELDPEEWEIVVVFSNTGKEREETLEFVKDCDVNFGFNTVWVEAVINPKNGSGTRHKIVSFATASRNGEPFEDMIKKYGIPNVANPHCTRELKTNAITSYVRRQLKWKGYYTAIGIRNDEADRINKDHKKLKYIYPLISMFPTRRIDVNRFWIAQSFTLKLTSYQGNCDLCFKKSDRKLMTIIKEDFSHVPWWSEMENKYGDFIPESKQHNENIKIPICFFRKNRSVWDLVGLSNMNFDEAQDESKQVRELVQLSLFSDIDISNGCTESCEPF